MKRALSAALAAYLFFSPLAVEAKILIVSTRDSDTTPPIIHVAQRRFEQLFTNVCDRVGVEYRLTNARGTKTLWAATGTHVWGSGAGEWTEQFDAVVHLGFLGADQGVYSALNGGLATCRPESMLIDGENGKTPTVPQLMVISGNGGIPASIEDQAACSTGVKGSGQFVGRLTYFATDQALRAIDGALTDAVVRNSTDPSGGFRPLIGASLGSLTGTTGVDYGTVGAGVNSSWPDSIVSPSTTRDSLVLWERPMAHISGAAPVVFVSIANDGFGLLDSITNANAGVLNAPTEGSAVLMLAALARLDSLTGGDVFTDQSKLPIKLGVTVDGAFSRNTRMHPRGIADDDSAIAIATLDSIVAYNALGGRPKIKLTVGVAYDSVDSYPNEKAWWSRLGANVRYSPQSWVNIQDTTTAGANNSFAVARDPLGRFAKRAAFGDTLTHSGTDSTTYKLLLGARYKTKTALGVERLSGLLMPADDDWSDKGATSDGLAQLDSTAFAIARAGFTHIRVNGVDRDCDPNYLRANHKGFFNKQQRFVSGVRGAKLNALAYNGFTLGGASKQALCVNDTTGVSPCFWHVKLHHEVARALNGLVYEGALDYEMFPYDNHIYTADGPLRVYDGVELNVKDRLNGVHNRASLMRLNFNDFSGAATRPARVGWWTLKSVGNSMEMINRLAGITIITYEWPEGIDP